MDKKAIVKMPVLPNLIYRFNAIWIKISTSYFADIQKLILMFICNGKAPRITNSILKKNKMGKLALLNSKT
jgi:hypothetical protein